MKLAAALVLGLILISYVVLGIDAASDSSVSPVSSGTSPVMTVHVEDIGDGFARTLSLFDAGRVGEPAWVKQRRHEWSPEAASPHAEVGVPESPNDDEGIRTVRLEVEAGRQYLLVAKWSNLDRTIRLVEVPEESPPPTVTVDAIERPVGYLLVEAALAEIDPALLDTLLPRVEGRASSATRQSLVVILEDPTTGLPIMQKVWEGAREGSHTFTCPSGPVRVVAVGRAKDWEPLYQNPSTGPRHHGRVEKIVEVRASGTSKVSATVSVGGVLRVEVRGDRTDGECVGEQPYAELFIEDAARHIHEPVTRQVLLDQGTYDERIGAVNRWPIGETHTSRMLPAGAFTLRMTFANGDPVETLVHIRSGQVSSVQWVH